MVVVAAAEIKKKKVEGGERREKKSFQYFLKFGLLFCARRGLVDADSAEELREEPPHPPRTRIQ